METWLEDIGRLFKEGLTCVHFVSKQWATITLKSGLKTAVDQQTSTFLVEVENSDQANLEGTEIDPRHGKGAPSGKLFPRR
ncbi:MULTISPECIES: hypothetical protein [Sporosarcina]|nr:hypothetical protein [Sporosarcina psychrophila]AMQ07066.1 hypothetical protein AZE41_14625 [Sporosarcina psychrophila]